ncbi:hypothetical protein GCM10023185_24990 [Hymenobacter saemangeumensis]|uniref:DUF481 domain-containing protein n=1 Tax=Hymenobacter saemangeumensis TaxID=1084522 RepID=A0ABP8IHF3_9BACT
MRFTKAFWQWAGALLLQAVVGQLALGQDLGSSPPTSPPTGPADSTARRGGFTALLSYGSNSTFFGRTQTTRYPYAAGELTYKSRFGVWGSVVSYSLFATSSFVDETDFSVGWDGDLSKKVDASASYSRFVFADNSPLVKSSVNNSLDAYLGLDWGHVYSRLNAAYLFGQSSDFFVVLDNSRYFEIDKVLTPKAYLAIEPRVSVTAGTQYFAETSIEQQQARGNIPRPVVPGRGSGSGPGQGTGGVGGPPTTTPTPAPTTTTTTTTTTRFQLLSYELRVPVTYTLGKWSAQVAWRYVVPLNLLPDDVSTARSFFTTSLSLNL